MNTFAGSIAFEGFVDIEKYKFAFHSVQGESANGRTNIYFYGNTSMTNSDELIKAIASTVGITILAHDISVSTEDKLALYLDEIMEGDYMISSISGVHETFESVKEQFEGSSPNIVAIREAEESSLFGNRVIKVDIVY